MVICTEVVGYRAIDKAMDILKLQMGLIMRYVCFL